MGNAARAIDRALAEGSSGCERPLVVVNKSTVPVGSGDYVSMLVREAKAAGLLYRGFERG